jgi:hypothetical protein
MKGSITKGEHVADIVRWPAPVADVDDEDLAIEQCLLRMRRQVGNDKLKSKHRENERP